MHTTSATSKILTYKPCLPLDRTFRFPVCLLEDSVDINSYRLKVDDKDIGIEDNSRQKEIQQIIGLASNLSSTTNNTDMEALATAIDSHSDVINSKLSLILFLVIFSFNLMLM